MSSGADEEFFARLAELNGKFAASLPQTLGRLSAAREAFDVARPQGALIAQLQAVLHTLAGSSATFGFRGLGQHARALEQRLRVLTTFDSVNPTEWRAWLGELDTFVAWGLRDPKGSYPNDEPGI
ncbi:Hpt domain-containing protein [Massilia sp. YIM B02763]|uniref:Hpt domain-containing protein n=1 Tax=Massilia sp. YIM B02763 TaxID=3050130 RepID=UPI0025B637C9|nr:Hpt domain-containing protein [Massilia sp. YIM B02763]MDN4054840.1 Hpt domain-containing protein [Massilia sp. YIM B02763]